jgi:hypothetical protein
LFISQNDTDKVHDEGIYLEGQTWPGDEEMHLIKWEKVCEPKLSGGGRYLYKSKGISFPYVSNTSTPAANLHQL